MAHYKIRIEGRSPLLMHDGAKGLDPRSPAALEIAEITRKRGSNRTEADAARLQELECQRALWLDDSEAPAIPVSALRAMIEESARKLKQGPQVREGLIVLESAFEYDSAKLGKTVEELGKKAQFTVGVRVGQARTLRTRPKFDEWACEFQVEVDDELVDEEQLAHWLDIGGRRIGIGDWRPSKSGHYGRFETLSIEKIKGNG